MSVSKFALTVNVSASTLVIANHFVAAVSSSDGKSKGVKLPSDARVNLNDSVSHLTLSPVTIP